LNNLPNIPAELETITLPDGTELNERQTKAALLHATSDLSHEQIAEQAGYASRQGVSTFLQSKHGKLAVRAALIQHMQDAGRTGLQATINLAKSSRSETVRQLAAAKLVEWSGIASELQAEQASLSNNGGRELNINIRVGGESGEPATVETSVAKARPDTAEPATIDITPSETSTAQAGPDTASHTASSED
jgi:hypothetical protein